MTIDFPCLQKDISYWYPDSSSRKEQQQQQDEEKNKTNDGKWNETRLDGSAEQLVQSFRRYLAVDANSSNASMTSSTDSGLSDLTVAMSQATVLPSQEGHDWLAKDSKADNKSYNIMSPVLKETPQSIWLAGKEVHDQSNDTREASLSTTLWLATSSTEPFTCVTRSTNSAAAIVWPEILYRDSANLWLPQRVERKDIDNWLANKTQAKHQETGNRVSNIFADWQEKMGSDDRLWNVKVPGTNDAAEEAIDEVFDKWLGSSKASQCQSKPTDTTWFVDHLASKTGEAVGHLFASWLSSASQEAPKAEQQSMSYVEKWLCLATEEEEEDHDISLSQDDGSSIAILNQSEDFQDDFDMIDDDQDELAGWLLN